MSTPKFIIICFVLISHVTMGQNLKKSWLKVLNTCGASQIVGKESLFFGPSNTIGLGSVWRKTSNKGYNPRFELVDLVVDSTDRQKMIKLGEKSNQCGDIKNVAWNSKAELPFVNKIFGLSGVSADFRKARRTTVSVDQLALDVLMEFPFEQAVKALVLKDSSNPYVTDLLTNDRLLVTKAYRLTGLIVKLDYDPKQLEELKSKYPNGGSINIGGEKGLNIEVNYASTSELTLKLPREVYIAGEFSRVTDKGTINLGDPSTMRLQFTAVKVDPEGKVGKKEELTRK